MTDTYLTATDRPVTLLRLVRETELAACLGTLNETQRGWVTGTGFQAKPGQIAWLADGQGRPGQVLAGWDGSDSLDTLGGLPLSLPEGVYRLDGTASELQLLGWGLGAYQFTRYKAATRLPASLLLPTGTRADRLQHLTEAVTLARDLINTPAADMLPSHLAAEAQQLAEVHGAECTITEDEALLDSGLYAIHAVGRAADDAPRLIDLRWGDAAHPLVVLVGKGVCFDSGGLDIKPSTAMRTMKKDMGGAAQALALAGLIMAEQLPVRLRVLIPAVENAIAGNAFRPGDILATYKGITVEIDNTDAEGRLVLCDALALAAEEKPAVMIDFATLTGAARSAVGAEISALFSNADDVADGILAAGARLDDPVWRMPLHQPYRYKLDSKVADITNSASTPLAGAVTAALFLERFVDEVPWAHFDINAFNTRSRPGRPEGGEAMAMRAVFGYLEERFAK
jgi:leucyl aminopeptidase